MWGFCGASGQAGGRDGPRLPCSVPGTALGPSCGQTPQPVGRGHPSSGAGPWVMSGLTPFFGNSEDITLQQRECDTGSSQR